MEEDEKFAQEMGQDPKLVLNEGGSQTVKEWRYFKETQGLEGKTGQGSPIPPIQIKKALQIFQLAGESTEDYEELATELRLDIEQSVLSLLDEPSPTGSRQIIRKYNFKHEYIPLTFSDLTTPTPGNDTGGFPMPTFHGSGSSSAAKARFFDHGQKQNAQKVPPQTTQQPEV